MADFCKECSMRNFGEDCSDFANICKEDKMVAVLCEGCGYIWVDKDGVRIDFLDDSDPSEE